METIRPQAQEADPDEMEAEAAALVRRASRLLARADSLRTGALRKRALLAGGEAALAALEAEPASGTFLRP